MIIYQVLVRLFGNTNPTRKPNGTIGENGCGKFNHFTDARLRNIYSLGATHVWYTGVIAHASISSGCNAAIVKGKAGSPYAIRDYYDVCPDLAEDRDNRMQEFEALLERTHDAGLKAIIDFVPNHVSRDYCSDTDNFGANDRIDSDFYPDNNFYYITDQRIQGVLNGKYEEYPARATGNDVFHAHPNKNDWYETVKLNYGVDYTQGWRTRFDPAPDTWHKMLRILLFWASKGVDGFRCDMAEMVPAEFWHYAINRVKRQYPNIIFIAEIYNPAAYHRYIDYGGFEYLYDKVGLYDTLIGVLNGQSARAITQAWQTTDGLQPHLLNFLENHDEPRIDSFRSLPALCVSVTINTSPFMLYFGQELSENALHSEGFSGADRRTTIFDYWALDMFLRKPTKEEEQLRNRYKDLLTFARKEKAITQGQFYDLMYANPDSPDFNGNTTYAYLRYNRHTALLIVCNFASHTVKQNIVIPPHAAECAGLPLTVNTMPVNIPPSDFAIINLSSIYR